MKTWQKLKENPKLFKRYFIKEYVIKAVREFFEKRNYHELESPILTDALPQERYLDVLDTKIEFQNGTKKTAYLIPSTENWNKKMLVAGLGNHFTISKVFRSLEEISPNHSPEFTMLEWYQLNSTYFDLMDTTEQLLSHILNYLKNNDPKIQKIIYQNEEINFKKKWERTTVRKLLKKFSGITLEEIQAVESFRKIAQKKGYTTSEKDDWQTLFELIFSNEIEPMLSKTKPTFVYDFPKILCPLTQVKKDDPLVSEKIELYIAGKEIGNGYSELNDWKEQKKRFDEEHAARNNLGKNEIKYDNDLIKALKLGMPKAAGIGIGLDRLVMILANVNNISDINLFPTSEWC